MRVELKSLKDNPFRNFKVDPIDPAVVGALKQSIEESPGTFWGGIVARKTKHDGIQLAFGHHRVRAAIAAGIREDDIKVVSNITDAEMIRMYALENATQRGNSGTAIAGTVASAVRFLLKGLFSGEVAGNPATSQKASDSILGKAGTESGIGHVLIEQFLDGIPGINANTVKQQLANIKASGDYDDIVEIVKAEVEAEQEAKLRKLAQLEEDQRKAEEAQRIAEQQFKEAEERRKEQARLAKAAKEEAAQKRAAKEALDAEYARARAEKMRELAEERAAKAKEEMKQFDALRKGRNAMNSAAEVKRDITFDYAGVAKHLKAASHIDTFREIVTGQGVTPYLPVNRQAELAKHLVEMAETGPDKVTSTFLRANAYNMVSRVKGAERRLDAEDKAELLKKDWSAKAANYQEEFARNARGMLAAALALSGHCKNRPQGVTLHATNEFSQAVKKAEDALSLMRKARII